jgi:CRISPR-associated protein Cas1
LFPGDLQEPFRWISDVAVMEAFESGTLDLPDFYFTGDDYRYRFEPEAKQRFLDLLRERFNSGVSYKERALKWDTVVERKAVELGRYLVGRSEKLDFSQPLPSLQRSDNKEVRRRILGLRQQEARRLGIGKSTLHYMRKNAESNSPLRVYHKVKRRLDVATSSLRIEV